MRHGRLLTLTLACTLTAISLSACAVVPTEAGGAVVGVHVGGSDAIGEVVTSATQLLPPPWGQIVQMLALPALTGIAVYQRRRGERLGWDEAEAARRSAA